MKFSELNLLSVGNTIQMAGAVFAGEGQMLICLFPQQQGTIQVDKGDVWFRPAEAQSAEQELEVDTLDMSLADWETFVRQTDVMETEVLSKASDGTLAKVILRKSQRAIDGNVQWKVWKKAGYKCEYCAKDDVPLTVDHLVTWELMGPTVESNLLACCKRCNKIRGNLPYAEWLRHPRYLEVSKNLSSEVRARNEALVATLDKIPRMTHSRSR